MLHHLTPRFALIAAPALMSFASPALAMTSAESAAFDAEINEAKSKMMGQSATALEHARKAHQLIASKTIAASKARLTAQWLEAEALLRLNRAGDASTILSDALTKTADRFEGSKLHADLLRSKASLNARSGAFANALPAFLKAQGYYADLGEARSQAIVLLNIGSLYSGARDFEKALDYFREGHKAYPNDQSLGLSAHNNMGNAFKGLKRFQEAEAAFAKALEIAKRKGSPLLEARILTNIASAQVLGGDAEKAKQTADTAMLIAQEHAPNWARFVDGVLAQIALSNGNLEQAQFHLGRAFDGEDLTKTASHFRDFHETAAAVSARMGDEPLESAHRTALVRLDAQVAKLGR